MTGERAYYAAMKTLLAGLEWSAGVSVFGAESVFVTAGQIDEAVLWRRSPVAAIRPQDGSTDIEESGLVRQRWSLTLAVVMLGDDVGEFSVMGRSGATDHYGILQVAEKVLTNIQALTRDAAIGGGLRMVATGPTTARRDENGRYLAIRDYLFEAHIAIQ